MKLASLLAQLQLTDSAFPSGLYTLSHGLEGYVQTGLAAPADLPGLLADLLRHSVGPGDATALVLAHRAVTGGDWDLLVAADRRLHAVKLNHELRVAATRTGRQVLETAGRVFGGPAVERLAALVRERATPGNHAVVVGALHATLGVSEAQAVAGDLYAFAASWTGAAVRLGRVDFRRAQEILYGAHPEIARAAAIALAARSPDDVHGSVPLADTVSAAHERASARLFTT
ncbi:urease accessory protein UreF [Streptosporangium carneum]|uniref:Urease accessory protein UreF n=1 Tax=Streptosporangium carneum TaxID=47481 RepID=A0A9W6I1R3_9ACTN|nr:urease accessory UreF family protein [Streptosporangium carneum]GLK10113.1 urease accessory protein UreF [Streptosporangium carneum]